MAKLKTKKKKKKSIFFLFLRDFISLFIWIFIICKLFIFDIDNYLISHFFPTSYWLIKFKFPIILFFLCLLLLLFKPRNIFLTFIYIIGFPFVILLWKLPKLFKHAPVFVTIIGASSLVISIKSAKIIFIISALYFISFLLIFTSTLTVIQFSAAILIFLLLLRHYSICFYYSFRTQSILHSITQFLKTRWAEANWNFLLKEIRDSSKYPRGSDSFKKKRFETLTMLFICHLFFQFVSFKLKEFYEKRYVVMLAIFKLVFTFFLTVVSFGFIYYAIYNTFSEQFYIAKDSDLFSFMYYSFYRFLMMDVPDFYSIGIFAKSASIFESIFAIFLGAILFSIFTTIVRDKKERELDALINQLNIEGQNIASIVTTEFGTSFGKVSEEMKAKDDASLKICEFFIQKIPEN